MLFVSRWLLIFGVLFITGCPTVQTTQPLSDPLTAEPDESLYGHWLATEKEDGKTRELHAFIGKHTTKENPEAIMEVWVIHWEREDKKLDGGLYYFTVTRIGKASYMNLIGVDTPSVGSKDMPLSLSAVGSYAAWTKNEKKKCGIVRYSYEGNKLQIWVPTDVKQALKGLSEAGELKLIGEVVTIDSLVRYLRKNKGEELFNKLARTFSKIP